MKKLFVTLSLAVGLAVSASAQSYYSANLIAPGTIVAGGSTNLVSQNYPAGGGWLSTKSITVNDPNAVGVTFQLASAQVLVAPTGAPQPSSNVVFTVALALDDETLKNRYIASNNTFTVTALASPSTNAATGVYSWIAQTSATNFVGAKYFKVINVAYNGTNNLNLLSARAGFYP